MSGYLVKIVQLHQTTNNDNKYEEPRLDVDELVWFTKWQLQGNRNCFYTDNLSGQKSCQ
jgi:hypothetical protein